MTSDVSSAAIL